jgi:hypothetical protein
MFVVVLATWKALNRLQTTSLSVGCMNYLYTCLYAKFEILQTTSCLWVVHALKIMIPAIKMIISYFAKKAH